MRRRTRPTKAPTFKIWYDDNKSFAEYLIETTKLKLYKPEIKRLSSGRNFGNNPDAIQKILYLDMPDVIVTFGFPEKPVLGVEFCAEAPSGHDIFQRVARVAASASLGTAFAFVFPEKKWVTRARSQRWDTYNPLSLRAMMNISRFHKIPALSFFWEANQISGQETEGFLLIDAKFPNMPDRTTSEMKNFSRFVGLTIDFVSQNKGFEEMMFDPFILDREAWMWNKYCQKRPPNSNIYQMSPFTSCRTIQTQELIDLIRGITGVEPNLPDYIRQRRETEVYQPRTNIFRSDPYSGSLVGIDYLACRNGETVRHRYRNLVMHFPNVNFSRMKDMFVRYYQAKCPFNPNLNEADSYLTLHLRDGCRYTKQKELRIYCYIADVLIFRDAVLY